MKSLFLSVILFLLSSGLYAQDFSFGKVKQEDFATAGPLVDSTTRGIVLNEYGYANIELSPIADKGFEIEYYYHTLIRILNKDGYEHANFTVPLYIDNTRKETLVEIKGITYNLEGGKVVRTELAKENVIPEKTSKNLSQVKVAFPGVKEGSIIELRYKTKSPFLFSLNAWTFQTDIPKLRSEFVTRIPEICTYRVNLKGVLALTDRKIDNYNTQLSTSVGEVRGVKTSYVMTDIPAFISEDYMTAAKNFTSVLTFELARYAIPFGPSETFSLTWEDVYKSLLENEDFGGQLKRKALLKDFIDPIVREGGTDYEKARRIYAFFKQYFKWNGKHGIFAEAGIKKAVEARTGNSADLNLALISALSYCGIPTDPIILSTRDNGYAGIYSAAISEFNHVVARAKIGDQYYFLDATGTYEPFGSLPLKCINHQGRSIPLNGLSDWVPLQSNLIASLHADFVGDLREDGTLVGQLVLSRGGYNASAMRAEVNSYNSLEEYLEDREKKLSHMTISGHQLENREDYDLLLKESMDIEVANFATVSGDEIHFSPLVYGRTERNPFNLVSRTYPVDIGSKLHENLSFSIRVPKGYTLTDSPGNKLNMALPNRDARYVFTVSQKDDLINLQAITQVNKPIFLPEEYFDLKEFFNRIIQCQKMSLTLHKIN